MGVLLRDTPPVEPLHPACAGSQLLPSTFAAAARRRARKRRTAAVFPQRGGPMVARRLRRGARADHSEHHSTVRRSATQQSLPLHSPQAVRRTRKPNSRSTLNPALHEDCPYILDVGVVVRVNTCIELCCSETDKRPSLMQNCKVSCEGRCGRVQGGSLLRLRTLSPDSLCPAVSSPVGPVVCDPAGTHDSSAADS